MKGKYISAVIAFQLGLLSCCHTGTGNKTVSNCKQDVQQLVDLVTLYSQDGSGKYPSTLADLIGIRLLDRLPKYRNANGIESDYIYLSGFEIGDSGDYAIVVSPFDGNSSERAVGKIDGEIVMVDSARAEQMIKESKNYLQQKTDNPKNGVR